MTRRAPPLQLPPGAQRVMTRRAPPVQLPDGAQRVAIIAEVSSLQLKQYTVTRRAPSPQLRKSFRIIRQQLGAS